MGQKFAAFDERSNVTAFYDSVDSPVPNGVSVVKISDEVWLNLINAQGSGKRLVIDGAGTPVAVDPPQPTRDERARLMRARRDSALHATDWLVTRHQEEKLIGNGTTLTAEQFTALINYRQTLRDVADADRWPDVDLPAVPDFVIAIA
ncbi:TPA: tail fiber assembly protein [Burkholderia vietnamiensis]|nr:tail fiber assembly protein [Burkholderia vietnamiensis]